MNTVLGPLTTTFTAPSQCATLWSNTGTVNRAQQCGNGSLSEDSACHPSTTGSKAPWQWEAEGYFSPGLYCPFGYATACYGGALATSASPFSFQYNVSSTLGVAGCCPSGYACNYATYPTCQNGPSCTVSFQICVSTPSASATLTGASCATTGIVSDATFTAASVFAPMFQLVAEMTSSSSGPGASSASDSISTNSSGRYLSGGAIAGIVLGALVGAIIVMSSIIFLLRRARGKGMSFTRRTTPDEKNVGWSELSNSQRSELSDTQRNELDDTQRSELPTFQRFELPAPKE